MNLLEEYKLIQNEDFIKNITEEELVTLALDLCNYWLENETDKNTSAFCERVWFSYEYYIWRLGDDLREVLKNRKGLQKSTLIQNMIFDIIINIKYGKGRETFALLIGDFKFQMKEDDLKQLLQDDDIRGHLIISLRKQKRKGFNDEIKGIMESCKGWIRQEAKKYLDKSSSW